MPEILWFIIFEDKLLLREGDNGPLPPRSSAAPLTLTGEVVDMGELGGLPCRAALTERLPAEGWLALDLRAAYRLLEPAVYLKAARAAQLAYWRRNSRFCPACGAPTGRHPEHPAMACPACGKLLFPKPTAAVLVLVEKGDSLLLVRAHNFKGDFHGLVAGYLDQGETLEECCRREVMEETGLSIKNLRYFGSEPWPFPNNVMIGFTSEYAGGEIRLQEEELAEAAFYRRGRLPTLPEISLTRRMIDWWEKGGTG